MRQVHDPSRSRALPKRDKIERRCTSVSVAYMRYFHDVGLRCLPINHRLSVLTESILLLAMRDARITSGAGSVSTTDVLTSPINHQEQDHPLSY